MRALITVLALLGIYGVYAIKRDEYCQDLKKRLYNRRQDMAARYLQNCASANPFNECLAKAIVFVDDKTEQDRQVMKEEKCE